MSVRVYVPATVGLLADYHDAGRVPPQAERLVAADESEEAEYDALSAAADASALLVGDRGRRVVLVAEVADEDAAFAMTEVVAVHVDTEPVDLAGGFDDLPDLGWFATQEIADLVV
ncbi:DUF6912 family protein [Marmoricola sp. RAF53]|uniref:DUF6912 family protein n=1 Tax=Marmoricola sp. RAF53 TaxID=3233059 RepID=UPI003F9CCF65